MIRVSLWTFLLAFGLIQHGAWCQDRAAATDSVKTQFVIAPRFNSAGHFPYTGALINKNINFDLNVFFERGNYGFFVFKSYDIEDPHSIVNYLQPGIFRKFHFSAAFQVRVFVGYLFSQTAGFRDADSDYYTAAVGYWALSDRLKLENTVLFFDLTLSGKLANRMLLSWTLKNFRVDLYVWHRVVFAQNLHATSASLAINLPRIKISEAVSIQNTLSYQGYLTREKPDFARRDGWLFSVAIPVAARE